MTAQQAAVLATLVLAGLACFQLLLAAGWPLGEFAWGGAHRTLPRRLRIASAAASFIYVLAGLMILDASGITHLVASTGFARAAVWILAALFAVGVVMNAISRSRKERRMAFVALLLSLLCVVVAVMD